FCSGYPFRLGSPVPVLWSRAYFCWPVMWASVLRGREREGRSLVHRLDNSRENKYNRVMPLPLRLALCLMSFLFAAFGFAGEQREFPLWPQVVPDHQATLPP